MKEERYDIQEELYKKLWNLAQLDIDAVDAYNVAIKNIDEADIKDKLRDFRDDHKQHVKDLNQEIVKLGYKAVENTPDLKGLLIKGFTALRSVTGTIGALKAMQGNEELTNRTYDEALEHNHMSAEVRKVIEKNRDDERIHLDYINMKLRELDR